MRCIQQPGPAPRERIQWIEAHGRGFELAVEPGLSLLEGVRRGFAQAGFSSGVLRFSKGALGPLAYVMPALSPDGANAAFYSEANRPPGIARLEAGALTFGLRDGQPSFHCHALWLEAGGRRGGGHILPEETMVAEPIEAQAFGIDGALFLAAADPETRFRLLGPVPRPGNFPGLPRSCFALRLRPNQDVAHTLEQFCRERGLSRAKLHGGVGSIIGARFADGRVVEPFATEIAITAGTVAPGADGTLQAQIDIALADYTGALATGRLARGDNPVLMTLELVVEAA